MQTHLLKRAGSRSALALLLVMSGGAVLAQAGSSGMPGDGGAGAGETSKFSDMKVSVDTSGGRLVVVIPPIMKSVGAEFIIDADVKNAIVGSHLTNVRLQTALDSLLRVSDIPVQVKFEKGIYRFSKRVDPLPTAPATKPLRPDEPILPPPPTTVQEDVGVHNVQTYDLLRVLNGLFGVSVAIDPSQDNGNQGTRINNFPGLGQGTDTGHGAVSGNGIGTGGRGNQSQNGNGGTNVTLFGHTFHLNNVTSGNGGNNGTNGGNGGSNGVNSGTNGINGGN